MPLHAGSLEALRVTRPEAVGLERTNSPLDQARMCVPSPKPRATRTSPGTTHFSTNRPRWSVPAAVVGAGRSLVKNVGHVMMAEPIRELPNRRACGGLTANFDRALNSSARLGGDRGIGLVGRSADFGIEVRMDDRDRKVFALWVGLTGQSEPPRTIRLCHRQPRVALELAVSDHDSLRAPWLHHERVPDCHGRTREGSAVGAANNTGDDGALRLIGPRRMGIVLGLLLVTTKNPRHGRLVDVGRNAEPDFGSFLDVDIGLQPAMIREHLLFALPDNLSRPGFSHADIDVRLTDRLISRGVGDSSRDRERAVEDEGDFFLIGRAFPATDRREPGSAGVEQDGIGRCIVPLKASVGVGVEKHAEPASRAMCRL